METLRLGADPRSGAGKGVARQLRREGRVPAVFYGPKQKATTISIDRKEFMKGFAAVEGSHLIQFRSTVPDLSDKVALVKEMQYHPVSGDLLHCDFYEINMQEKLRVEVPLHFTGKAVGVALGGILQPIRRSIDVECLPGDIPSFIEVDVSALDIHDSLHAADLQLPVGVEALYETNFTLVTVAPPTVEEVKPTEAAEAEAAAAVAPVAAEAKESPEK